MKKFVLFVSFCLAGSVVFFGCGSTPKIIDSSGPTEIIEHKGTAFGIAQPKWVFDVFESSSQKSLCKALGIDKHIWVVSKSGENLDFIKTWVDQVDARAEIASSIKQGVSDFVGAKVQGEGSDVEETVERYSARASAITVSGLNKETDWWLLGRNERQKKSDGEYKYTYLVVYSMDQDLYEKQVKKAFKGEDEKVVDELIQYLMNYTMVSAKE
ncbi:hypothetical protein [Treponema berlinense]|uniref:hypothetical protein n=1 Tax=Treponema berlinense TaxID=225004 RepID=UPI0026F14E6C|nr:hypothetical protein [Treponema berlinense]